MASTKATMTVTDSANRNVRSLMMDPPAQQTDGWVGWRQTVARAPRLVNAGGRGRSRLTTGRRRGEVCALRIRSVDFERAQLIVDRKEQLLRLVGVEPRESLAAAPA